MMTRTDLGSRIAIIGTSNSGKSTLADALSRKMDVPVLHLDQIAHIPGTNWQRDDISTFIGKHDAFIDQPTWIIEGNYSICIPQRFARATSILWLNPPITGCVLRYLKRCFLDRPAQRKGQLENATHEFSFGLLRHIMAYPKNREKYARFINDAQKPFLGIETMKMLNTCYTEWELTRRADWS